MVALSSSGRKGSNPAIRARVFSISAFDSQWYLKTNGLSNVSLNKAWSHYRSLGQAEGLQARYEVTQLALNLIAEEFSSSLTESFRSALKRTSFEPVFFLSREFAPEKRCETFSDRPFLSICRSF